MTRAANPDVFRHGTFADSNRAAKAQALAEHALKVGALPVDPPARRAFERACSVRRSSDETWDLAAVILADLRPAQPAPPRPGRPAPPCDLWDGERFCGALPTRQYLPGPRCTRHTPSALVGRADTVPDPTRTLHALRVAAGRNPNEVAPLAASGLLDDRAVASGKRRAAPAAQMQAQVNVGKRPAPEPIERTATLSPDGLYRYALGRAWGSGPTATFVMLNPSTADGYVDDATIRRCIGFARREGCGSLSVVNLYAWRATRPADLWRAPDPVGPSNDLYLETAAGTDGPLIAAWGTNAKANRVDVVLRILGNRLLCLAMTQDGAPGHPLYLPADAPLQPFERNTR